MSLNHKLKLRKSFFLNSVRGLLPQLSNTNKRIILQSFLYYFKVDSFIFLALYSRRKSSIMVLFS
uniref:Uncharacterized protein n=1 Tax=Siphoviridae sp. ctLqe90 TaxID=2825456 RepID=A0A8S5Q3I8_9CAUD|nr:MAG TPA: hypothetical protein [Siphoviridae sp. ctLqe90]